MKSGKLFTIGVLCAVAGMHLAIAQAPQEFDVAAIKLNESGEEGYSIKSPPGGRFLATNITVSTLIQLGLDVRHYQVSGGPGWVDSERYDINAKAAIPGTLSQAQLKLFCNQLLLSRFGFKFHTETRELTQYALVAAKGGLRLHPDTSGPGLPQIDWGGRGNVSMTNVSMALFAKVLSSQLDRNVVDVTAAAGNFDFKLTWSPDQASPGQSGDTSGASIFTALQEQYGLKVETRKGPVQTIVIDHIDRPTEN